MLCFNVCVEVSHLDVLHHELLLGVVHGAVGALEDGDPVAGQVLVKVGVQEGLLGEHRVTHGALVDQPGHKINTVTSC